MAKNTNRIFEIGQPYFLVGFYDEHFKILKIDTYIFEGRESDDYGATHEVGNGYCFRDPGFSSRLDGKLKDIDTTEEIIIVRFSEEDATMLVDKQGLIECIAADGQSI